MKNFRLNLILRIIILLGLTFLLFYLYTETTLIMTTGIVLVIILLHSWGIIRYIDKTNDELTRFLLSVKYSDFAQTFTTKKLGGSFNDLDRAFNEVLQKFRDTRSEKEENYRYLQTVMQHVPVGLISYTAKGKVEFINNAAKKLMKINALKSIKELSRISPNLGLRLEKISHGEKITFSVLDDDDLLQIIAFATEFKMRDNLYKLVSLQNIQSELEEKEMDAWQKLIRVLTHEIMNSVTPISSLAGTVNSILMNHNYEDTPLDAETIEDMRTAVATIEKRSEGLIHFVENYRNLTKIPKPKFRIFKIAELFETIEKLMREKIEKEGIDFYCSVTPRTLELTADPQMLEQVLINMLVNAAHAVSSRPNPHIYLMANLNERGRVIIKVIDNGIGIPEDQLDKIFIPFYSTKKDGSGIGLSLSRQIIRAHGGNIRVTSTPNVETVFSLRF